MSIEKQNEISTYQIKKKVKVYQLPFQCSLISYNSSYQIDRIWLLHHNVHRQIVLFKKPLSSWTSYNNVALLLSLHFVQWFD